MVSFLKAFIPYLSYSGNTEEVAEIIEKELIKEGFNVDMHQIGMDLIPDLSNYDLIFLGSFTWESGSTPDEVKDFALEVGYKPNNIAVFGTGDTQFGPDDRYCGAAKKLAAFYNSPWEVLRIEQSPRGHQEKYIKKWVEGVLQSVKSIA